MKSKPEELSPREPEELTESLQGIEYAAPQEGLKPLYLLADSQLLFHKDEAGEPFVCTVRARLEAVEPSAAYIGASNGDDPAFYSIFEAAMDEAAIDHRAMILAELDAEALAFVDRADWIVLAGGDVARGWWTFKENGLSQILMRRYYEGALLMGISAGAVQLGLGALSGAGAGSSAGSSQAAEPLETFRLVPHLIGAHQEADDWQSLAAALRHFGGHARGYGIPSGGGMIYHPDHTIEPLRRPLVELSLQGETVTQSLLLPGAEEVDEAEDGGEAGGPGEADGELENGPVN